MPALSMLSPEKVATPATATAVLVPLNAPPPGFVPIASVSVPVKVVAVLLWASCAVSVTPNGVPAVVLDGGGVVKTSLVAGPGVPLAVNVSGEPASVPDAALSVLVPAA